MNEYFANLSAEMVKEHLFCVLLNDKEVSITQFVTKLKNMKVVIWSSQEHFNKNEKVVFLACSYKVFKVWV